MKHLYVDDFITSKIGEKNFSSCDITRWQKEYPID